MSFSTTPEVYFKEIDTTYPAEPFKITCFSYEEAQCALYYNSSCKILCVDVPRAAYVTNCAQAKRFFEGEEI